MSKVKITSSGVGAIGAKKITSSFQLVQVMCETTFVDGTVLLSPISREGPEEKTHV